MASATVSGLSSPGSLTFKPAVMALRISYSLPLAKTGPSDILSGTQASRPNVWHWRCIASTGQSVRHSAVLRPIVSRSIRRPPLAQLSIARVRGIARAVRPTWRTDS